MRSQAFPKVYRSFEEFERDELRKLDGLHLSVDEMLQDMFGEELDFENGGGGGRKNEDDDE
jgi:hypothetical protein